MSAPPAAPADPATDDVPATAPTRVDRPTVAAAPLARPAWRRARLWLVLVVVVVLAAVAFTAVDHSSGVTLDPSSTQPNGGQALADLLRGYGTAVRRTSSLRDAHTGTVLVTDPDAYTDAQLQGLRTDGARLVLVRPTTTARAFGLRAEADPIPFTTPQCNVPAAVAAGRISWPDDLLTYRGRGTSCYDGFLVVASDVAVIGSSQALQNSDLARPGLAALDVNTITADRTVHTVTWLLPGADAGARPATVWALFPPGVHRVALWLVLVAVLLVLWRARRLGGVVTEPLPVVVRSTELVEGHGRLYARARARDHAARVLRSATARRLRRRLLLPATATVDDIAGAADERADARPVREALTGPAPADDAALLVLARELDRLEAATATAPPGTTGTTEEGTSR